jgi:hypothetical protein
MPPAKAKLKAVAQAASNARFVNIPRLSTPPNYRNWLNKLLDTHQNRKTLVTTEKLEIDGLLRRQADQQFKNDSGLLKRALAEVRSQDFTTLNDTNRCRRQSPRPASTLGRMRNLALLGSATTLELDWWKSGHRLKKQ